MVTCMKNLERVKSGDVILGENFVEASGCKGMILLPGNRSNRHSPRNKHLQECASGCPSRQNY